MLALTFPSPESLDAANARRMAHAVGGRITVVRADGKVLVDTEAQPSEMENHGSRKEIREAFQQGSGSEIRQSATIGVSFLYVAVPVAGGTSAIRIAFPLSEINRQIERIRGKLLVSTSVAFLPAILIAAILARFISRRLAAIMAHAGELARGNFRARLPQTDSSEFGQLEQTLNETAENLQQTVAQLQHEHAELEKLERIRKDFVINVSHELRTPLASIQGYTETLIDGALADPDHNMRFLRYHPAQCRTPGAADRRSADALASGAEAPEVRVRYPLGECPDSRRLRTGGPDRAQELYRTGGRPRSRGCRGLLR